MNRFLLTSTLVLGGLLGFSKTASAQYSYGYQTYMPGYGAYVGNRTFVTPFGARTTTSMYSPAYGYGASQTYYGNAWGNNGYRWNVYSPYSNYGYGNGYGYGYNNYNYNNAPLYRSGYLHHAYRR